MAEAKKSPGEKSSASKSGGGRAQEPPDDNGIAGLDEALRPFREASLRFTQAAVAAQESVVKETLDAHVALQEAAREIERDAYEAVMDAAKRHQERSLEQTSGTFEEMFFARAQSQLQYESDVRDAYANAQAKLVELAQRGPTPEGDEVMRDVAARQQEVYQRYIADLQEALSGSGTLDPQAMRLIASDILCALGV